MKIYISLPISSRPKEEAMEHADRIRMTLSRAGHTPVNPLENYIGKNATYADYICADLRILADCDAIFLCEGWQFSRGCRIEANFAKEFNKQFMYERQPEQSSEYFFER